MGNSFVKKSVPHKNGAVVKVVGIGRAGCNAIGNMVNTNIGSVDYVAINTDSKALNANNVTNTLIIGNEGLSTDGNPEMGKKYALKQIGEIQSALKGANLVIIACGLGGGTGGGAAPIVAAEARAAGAVTVAIVYTPHSYEGQQVMDIAKKSLDELEQHVDSYIVISNDNISVSDDVLLQSIQGLCEIAIHEGDIGIDIDDIRTAMQVRGQAFVGMGHAEGEHRAEKALENALKNSHFTDASIKGAYAVLLNISGNEDNLMMDEVVQISAQLCDHAGSGALIIDGVSYDERKDDSVSVTLVVTGIKSKSAQDCEVINIYKA